MTVKFHYPSGPRPEREEEDFAISEAPEKADKPAAKIEEPKAELAEEVPKTKAPDKEGFVRLVNFIKAHVKEKKDPEKQKKTKAIQAYKKIKDAA